MSILTGKTLVVLGDSLVCPAETAWPALLGKSEQMTVYNYGIPGNSIAYVEGRSEPMVRRYKAMHPQADYVVLLGGANDKNQSVPLGGIDAADENTFIGALRLLAAGLIDMYPKARILFLTNYNRRPKPNALGLHDIDYVDAMIRVAAEFAIPCFDNFRNSGISFHNPAQKAWMDRGLAAGKDPDWHFSPEAYEWLMPKYRALLESL